MDDNFHHERDLSLRTEQSKTLIETSSSATVTSQHGRGRAWTREKVLSMNNITKSEIQIKVKSNFRQKKIEILHEHDEMENVFSIKKKRNEYKTKIKKIGNISTPAGNRHSSRFLRELHNPTNVIDSSHGRPSARLQFSLEIFFLQSQTRESTLFISSGWWQSITSSWRHSDDEEIQSQLVSHDKCHRQTFYIIFTVEVLVPLTTSRYDR